VATLTVNRPQGDSTPSARQPPPLLDGTARLSHLSSPTSTNSARESVNATPDPKEKWHTDASAMPDTASVVSHQRYVSRDRTLRTRWTRTRSRGQPRVINRAARRSATASCRTSSTGARPGVGGVQPSTRVCTVGLHGRSARRGPASARWHAISPRDHCAKFCAVPLRRTSVQVSTQTSVVTVWSRRPRI